MERLASQGVKFTQAYAASVCSPTRISLLTGMNTARHRVTNWTLHKDKSTDIPDEVLAMPQWNVNSLQPIGTNIPLSIEATTLPDILRKNGYTTIHCGKAHMGAINTPGENPLNLGFDINIAGHAAGSPASYLGMKKFGNTQEGKKSPPNAVPGLEKYYDQEIFLTEALTLEAMQALDKARKTNKPFFLHMSHYAIHTPIEADQRFFAKYKSKGLEDVEASYASLIEGMDKSLGDLMDYLEQHQLSDNTIIIFYSDNGGLSAHTRGGTKHTHNRPLKSGKGSAYEGGIRVPFIVKWPNKVKQNSVSEDFMIVEDLFPTILKMAGVDKYETLQVIDGVDLTPTLTNSAPKEKSRKLVWHYPNTWGASGPGIGTYSAIRNGDWKLIYWYKNRTFELYNIKSDIGELSNLASIEHNKAEELASQLSSYLRGVNAQRPTTKKNNLPVPWPDEVPISTDDQETTN